MHTFVFVVVLIATFGTIALWEGRDFWKELRRSTKRKSDRNG